MTGDWRRRHLVLEPVPRGSLRCREPAVFLFVFRGTCPRMDVDRALCLTQPEILRYLNYVADRFDLSRHIEFSTRVTEARFDESSRSMAGRRTEHGGSEAAQFLHITGHRVPVRRSPPHHSGHGGIPRADLPDFSMAEEGVDLAGKRVGIIGTGSSAVQAIPLIAEAAEHLTVFQRTPNYSFPARNTAHDRQRVREFVENFADYRARARRGQILGAGDLSLPPSERGPSKEPALTMTPQRRREIYERRWLHGGGQFVLAFPDLMIGKEP